MSTSEQLPSMREAFQHSFGSPSFSAALLRYQHKDVSLLCPKPVGNPNDAGDEQQDWLQLTSFLG
jgi:hypothetical protein